MALPDNPITREEMYLSNIAGEGTQLPDHPVTRVEQYLDYIANNGGGGGGTTNYEALSNKPQINGTTLSGNKTSADLGLQDRLTFDATPTEESTNPVTSGGVYGALETKADASELETTKTATGSIVTVEDAAPINAEDVTVQIEPVQDLHGYDHPWAGGAGVNLFSEVWNNVGDVTIRGESINVTPNTTYYGRYYDLPNDNTLQLYLAEYDNNDTLLVANLLSVGRPYATITTSANTAYIKPQINFTAGSKPTGFKTCVNVSNPTINGNYFPYANECPISGWDEVEVTGTGKNLLNPNSTIDNYTVNEDGTYNTANPLMRVCSDFIPSSPNTDYVVSGTKMGNHETIFNFAELVFYDADKNYIGRESVLNSNSLSGTTPQGTKYIRYGEFTGDINIVDASYYSNYKRQLELGSTATTYEPYAGTTYTVTLPDTIYGGTLDVTTGELVVDRASVDLGTLNWTYVTGSSTFYADDDLNEKRTTGITVKCDRYLAVPNISDVYAMQVDNSICVRSVADEYHRVYVKDRRFTNAEDFTTAVAGAQLVYELGTPQTYQLTPTQVKMLLNYNNIWANSGDTTLEYQPNNVIGDIKGEIKGEIEKLTDVPTEDGTYVLTATVSSGVVSYEWVEQE